MDKKTWERIEADFRAWSFHVFYRRTYRNEQDPVLRFLKALKASCRPLRDPELVWAWYRKRKEKAAHEKATAER